MKSLDWLREPPDQAVRPAYAVYGDDPYLVRESIQAVVRRMFADSEEAEAAVTRFPGATTPLASVLDEVGRWMNEGISLFARQWQAIQEAETAVPNTS